MLLLLALVYTLIVTNINYKPTINKSNHTFYGHITSYKIDDDKISFVLKGKENLKCNIYENIEKYKSIIRYGVYIKVTGDLEKPQNNTVPNNFNYKEYLYNQKIFFLCNVKKIKEVNHENFFYKIKNYIVKRVRSYNKTSPYLLTFILGDKSLLDEKEIESYQKNGITHLFAISGMHITFFATTILLGLKKLKVEENKRYLITIIYILFYMFLTGFSESVLRAGLFFILLSFNKIFYTEIKTINILLLTLSILLFINPFIINSIAFLYSFMTTLGLIIYSDFIEKHTIIGTSLIANVFALPITINNFYEINPFTIFINIIFVPFVSTIVYPLSIITFIFKFLNPILIFLTNILEFLNHACTIFYKYKIIIPKLPKIILFLYYLLIIFKVRKKLLYICVIVSITFIYFSRSNSSFVNYIDVGQGDSILIKNQNNTILIDTGGNAQTNYHVSDKTITYLKSICIKKINYLILSHGDYDHMGEAINLVNNFKVEEVIFNCGSYESLEKNLIKVLNKKKIKYYSCIKELNIDKNKLYFLQTKEYDNENDNSNVIFTELNGYKFMLMGDAGIDKERDILDKYNISNIDVLKVGHHGSKTSSSKEFINETNPKYSIISVGKNNRYGHPNKEAIDNLKNSKIYRTDQDGSIVFKIKNNKLKIETYSP